MRDAFNNKDLIPHLFRTEFSRIVAVLIKSFGIEHLQAAEDLTGETFLSAMETWPYRGVPENPTAWLYAVAKNKARNFLARNNTFKSMVMPQLRTEAVSGNVEIDLSESNITDSQLQMMFAVCHPTIPPESQIGLALRILCGFGVDEIATAFLTNRETINKRLFRAREKLRIENTSIAFPPEDKLNERLDNVLTTLYLLFSEGYYSESNNAILREDLCLEAMRLTRLLLDCDQTRQPAVYALLAMMCFHASRFRARKSGNDEMILYDDQDETLWDRDLIARGAEYLHKSSTGASLSRYHLEAQIAYWHTVKIDTPEKWDSILQLYNRLLMHEYSPVAALNRTYALYKVKGRQAAILEAEKLNLTNNRYYFTLLGELYRSLDPVIAKRHFLAALDLAITEEDKRVISHKMASLTTSSSAVNP